MNSVSADQITRALSKRNKKDIFLTEVKTGATWAGTHQRLDAVAIKPSWTQPCITIYEVKVSRSDFMADEKYIGYLPLCHRFYFACPSGLIKAEELREDIGLIYYKAETGGLRTVKKALFRPLENLPTGLLYYLVLSRLGDHERHPFFSSTREFCERYVEDKEERHELGRNVASKMARTLKEFQDSAQRHEVGHAQRLQKEIDEADAILGEHGLHLYNLKDELPRRLNGEPRAEVRYAVRDIAHALERMEHALQNGDTQ